MQESHCACLCTCVCFWDWHSRYQTVSPVSSRLFRVTSLSPISFPQSGRCADLWQPHCSSFSSSTASGMLCDWPDLRHTEFYHYLHSPLHLLLKDLDPGFCLFLQSSYLVSIIYRYKISPPYPDVSFCLSPFIHSTYPSYLKVGRRQAFDGRKEDQNMPVIEVMLLPDMEQKDLERLYDDVWEQIERITALKLTRERPQAVTVLFPKDMMQKGIGDYFLVRVSNLTPKPERTTQVLMGLAYNLADMMNRWFPNAKFIEVVIDEKHPNTVIHVIDKEVRE